MGDTESTKTIGWAEARDTGGRQEAAEAIESRIPVCKQKLWHGKVTGSSSKQKPQLVRE